MKTKTSSYSLLIYWGEDVSLYLIPDETADKKRKTLKRCQGKFINSDDYTKSMGILSALVAEKKDHVAEKELKKYACKWKGYKVGTKKPLTGKHISTVYITGWVP